MVYPNILPPSVAAVSSSSTAPAHPPRVEYLATLAKHQAPVNVVRFSPNGKSSILVECAELTRLIGELLASAGDGE